MICRNLGYVQTAQKTDREKNILMEYNKLSVLELLMKNLTKRDDEHGYDERHMLNHLSFESLVSSVEIKYSDPLFSRSVLLAGGKEDLFGS